MAQRLTFLVLVVSAFLAHIADGAENWPQFRGPQADGVAAADAKPPITWSRTKNVKWFADVPGWGWSCPIVWEDKVFVTSVVSEQENLKPSKGLYLGQGVRDPAKGVHHWLVHCIDLNTGKEIWRQEAHTGKPTVPRHPKSTYASETAATDGERLYVLFGDVGLYCYDLDGKPLWDRKIEAKKTARDYGAAASPVVHDGQVLVVYDNLEESWIASFDAETGKDRWRTPRDETHSWATPFVWKNELRTEIVVPGKRRNRSYSLDGKVLWEFDGRMSTLVIPSPFAAHGMCYIASGYIGDRHRPTFAIRPGAAGDITPAKDGEFTDSEFIAWHQPQASPYNPTQIVYGDYLYTAYDRGFLTCHNAKTGEEVYGKQRFTPRGSFTASPTAANGHLYFLSEDGLTYVIKAGEKFEIVARNELDELSIACPAVVGDKMLVRTASRLYCMQEGAELPADRAALLSPTPSTPTAKVDPDAAKEAKLEIEKAVESGKVAGGAHLVVINGKTQHLASVGVCDIEDKRPLKPDTILRIYSMTKPITSVAAMTLYEQGKFRLDDPVAKFIPAFANTTVLQADGDGVKVVPAKRPLTVRDVFRHTTGFSYGDGNPNPREFYEKLGMRYRSPAGMLPPRMSIKDAAEALAKIPALHHPGERFTYGFSTDLLGRLIEVWSGKPLDVYLRNTIFQPLAMADTGFAIPLEKRSRFASCHILRDGKLSIVDKAETSPFNEGFVFLSGGGGLLSTMNDYANFCQMLVDDGRFRDKSVLKKETLQLMFTDQLNGVAGGFRFGLGFAIADVNLGVGDHERRVKQYSWGGYASTDFRVVPEENIIQIVVRQQVPSSHGLANKVIPIIYKGVAK